jgi:uncharacterized RDD family membrane protein YckC
VALVLDVLFLSFFIPFAGRFVGFHFGGFLGPFLYFTLCEWLWGMTFGKWALGLRVISTCGSEVGLFQAALRSIGKILTFIPLFIPFIFVFLNFQRRGLHDFLADTRVVYQHSR